MAETKRALVLVPKVFHKIAKARANKADIPLQELLYKWLQAGLAADKAREK